MTQHTPPSSFAIDHLLDSMSLINCVWLAMQDKNWIDDGALDDLATTLEMALNKLKPVRNALNGSGLEI